MKEYSSQQKGIHWVGKLVSGSYKLIAASLCAPWVYVLASKLFHWREKGILNHLVLETQCNLEFWCIWTINICIQCTQVKRHVTAC